MLKSELEEKLSHWEKEVDKALLYVEGKDYDIEKVKAMVSILLILVGRPNPPMEDGE